MTDYSIGKWKGKTKYMCRNCNFDTLNLDTMKQHIQDRHTPQPKKEPVKVPVYDRFGNLIKHREV